MQNIKGTYDYFGKEQALRKNIQNTLQDLFELYDFESMDTTLLNELELLTSKYAGGDEILKEMYQLTDQGNRKLGLRYDLTIPFAKVIALNPGIVFPFKRYEIGKVFRDGPVKRGRLREFLQCDVDVVGISGPEAEAELMQLATEAFRKLDIPIILKWNNRRFLGEILESIGVPAEDQLSVMLTLDKLEKINLVGVKNELISKEIESATIAAILELIEMDNPSFEQLCEKYSLTGQPGAMEVLVLQKLLQDIQLQQTCRFDPFLSRGLSFYTGTVYEIFDASGSFTSSLGGGGRYDAIIGQLVGREDIQYPTVGLSFGMESIMALLAERPIQERKTAEVMVIPIGETLPQALIAAAELRACSIRTNLVSGKRKLKKQLATASSQKIRYVILIGESESSVDKVRLKDMKEQTEVIVPLDEAIYLITG
ncbi:MULTISPECIES: histidine--tRNA ligase [unclassified Paenibacillus]|uniref:histidine--tRNA ligase n=1 Tax=unclassified Paenibacillus TaxID=185978 RepID=UPI0024769AE4|nr:MULTISPECIES: histidine--tRNA ligase [unclassified Paenibacillus]MDH6426386.1 histidyl-tRNA synthetase [Paenibacillus sp. PastH-4]MDH6442409.1 histidyl-tRNA synthetase [Paenibacillus sp. PastF-4]MDH6526878.1 histidyl-tRNA synthetase [Paenibacillus sp. PastH-3]